MKIIKRIKETYPIFFITLLFIVCSESLFAQQPVKAADTSNYIHIIHSDNVGRKTLGDSSVIDLLSGKVSVKQNNTLFYCDSVAWNRKTNILEAYGHVHINDNDTVNIYGDFMRYQSGERTAFLKGNVKLTDGKGTLTTSQLDYDLNTKIAVYSNKGKLISGKSVLTSVSGTYYSDTRDVQFNNNVLLVDPEYTITTDTLLYNTYTRIATFTVPTKITSGPYKSIQTTDGYYDLINKKSYLGKRPVIIDSSSTLIADEVAAEDISGFGEARGNVVFKDTAQGIVILCNDLKTNREQSSFLATINPVMVLKQNNDSIFIAADTLYSARFADSADIVAKADSLNNISPAEDSVQLPIDENAHIDTGRAENTVPLSFKKEGKVFIWPKDSTQQLADTVGLTPIDTVHQQHEKKKLFDIFKKNKNNQAKDTATEKEKKSILDIFKKKDASEGKTTPSIIDSVKAAKDKPVIIDSTVALKPGIDFSAGDAKVNKKDSIKQEDNKSRFLEAYYNVRIFSDSLQGIGDSLYYSSRDSLFQLFKNPTVWTTSNNQISQISGDTIDMYTANNKPQYIHVADNAIMISQADTLHKKNTSQFFNQMGGNKIDAWFTDGQLDSISAQGNATGVFYGLDEENKYIGVTKQESRTLNFYFLNKELQRIVGKMDVTGKVYPMRQVDHEKIRLKNFDWLEDKRPKSKYELLAH